jgi:cysteine synthase A
MIESDSIPSHDDDKALQQARQFLEDAINDPAEPLVIFAVGYCEYSRAALGLFDALELEHRRVDPGAEEFRASAWGRKLRQVLREYTGSPTVPQIFIAGKLIGGATDFFDAYRSGSIQSQLQAAGLSFKPDSGLDPYRFLAHSQHSP